MGVNAIISEGKIVETASQQSVKNNSSTSSTPKGYDKDSFLQLLVAQMKYQDPLEPTSNTEYISQYATFSQVEQLQNMAGSMDLSRASSMVGQMVEVSSKDSGGDVKTVQGTVEYVKYENNKAYVSIGGALYAADDVTAVVDPVYNEAYELAEDFADAVNHLPSLEDISLGDATKVATLKAAYGEMTSYQQSFVDKSYTELLDKYIEKINELQRAKEKQDAVEQAKAEAESNDEAAETDATGEA